MISAIVIRPLGRGQIRYGDAAGHVACLPSSIPPGCLHLPWVFQIAIWMFSELGFQKPGRLEAWMVWGRDGWRGGGIEGGIGGGGWCLSGPGQRGEKVWSIHMVGKQQDPPWADRCYWSLSYALLDDSGYPNLSGDEQSASEINDTKIFISIASLHQMQRMGSECAKWRDSRWIDKQASERARCKQSEHLTTTRRRVFLVAKHFYPESEERGGGDAYLIPITELLLTQSSISPEAEILSE